MDDSRAELLKLSQKLIDAIDQQDWSTYSELCDPSLTACEPEGVGHLIRGMPFHHFYFKLSGSGRPRQSNVCDPDVRLMGDVAVVSYVRLVQKLNESGAPGSYAYEETRVWQRIKGAWKHVHFHRSPCGSAE